MNTLLRKLRFSRCSNPFLIRSPKINPYLLLRLNFSSGEDNGSPEDEKDVNSVETSKAPEEEKPTKQDQIPGMVLASPVQYPLMSGTYTTVIKNKIPDFSGEIQPVAYFMPKKDKAVFGSIDDFHSIGTLVTIKKFPVGKKGIHLITTKATRTVKAEKFENGFVKINNYGDESIYKTKLSQMSEINQIRFKGTEKAIKKLIYHLGSSWKISSRFETAEDLRAAIFCILKDEKEKIQNIISQKGLSECLQAMEYFVTEINLSRELNVEAHHKILKESNEMTRQRLLMTTLSIVKKKLGIKDETSVDPVIDKCLERLSKKDVPKDISKVVDYEIGRIRRSQNLMSSENEVALKYIELLSKIPWGVYTTDNFDLDKARKILDEDHYGLKDVKDRIIEFIAIGKLKKALGKGKVVCLVGPPGIGKTSICNSIGRAVGKKVANLTMGGISDVSDVNGNRRTYVGSNCGRIVSQLIKANSLNPLFVIDEVDKLSTTRNVMNTLLELLDGSQNTKYTDRYVDEEIDLSKVLFMCTANDRSGIIPPLADRMEFIDLSGYLNSEKLEIAKNFIIPKVKKETGLKEGQISFTDDAVKEIIDWYCREPGVRGLERAINKCGRKAIVIIFKEKLEKVVVDKERVKEFLGSRIFDKEVLYRNNPPGIVTGLAWDSLGGCALPVETSAIEKKTKKGGVSYEATGALGDVMKESTKIAFFIVQNIISRIVGNSEVDQDFFEKNKVHIHFPEGAVKKDGPSAGVTLVTALMSLATKTPVKKNIAMTGEVSLTGVVLKIGGLKEKIHAARRSFIYEVIIPRKNEPTWNDLQPEVKEGMTVHFVDRVEEVLSLALPSIKLS